MYRTVELLDRLKATYHLPSDGAVARKLGITRSAVSNYVNGKSFLDNKIALEVAELLDINPMEVMASIEVERAERKQDKTLISFWQKYAH